MDVRRPASLVDWSTAPQLVPMARAAFLLGVDRAVIDEIVSLGGVDAVERDGQTLIDKASLREFWELYHDSGGIDD